MRQQKRLKFKWLLSQVEQNVCIYIKKQLAPENISVYCSLGHIISHEAEMRHTFSPYQCFGQKMPVIVPSSFSYIFFFKL